MAEAFGWRQIVPFRWFASIHCTLRWVFHCNNICEIAHNIFDLLWQAYTLYHLMNHIAQQCTVDRHKIALYVHFEHISTARIVVRHASNVMPQPIDAHQCAFAVATGIGVIDKLLVEAVGHIVIVEMMHHAVAKIGCKDLAFHRVAHHKAYRGRWLIAAVAQFVIERDEVGFQIHLEAQLAGSIPLVAARVIIGLE